MQNLTAATLAGTAWIENGQRAEYTNARNLFGITNGAGLWLSFDGVQPYTPRGGRRAAAEVAATIGTAAVSWVRAI